MLDPSVIMLMRFSLYLLFFTGAFMLIRMLQTRLYNLFGLVMFFILFPTNLLFSIYFDTFLSLIIINTYYSFLALFVKNTFYKEQESYYSSLLYVIIALRLYEFVVRILFQFESLNITPTDPFQLIFFTSILISYYLQPILVLLWLAIASISMYKNLKKIKIKNWIKARYLIIGISSMIYLLETFNSIYIRITKSYTNPISAYLSVIVVIIFSFANLIVWVFPRLIQGRSKPSKALNEEEISEKELLIQIKKELSTTSNNGNN